LRDPLKFGIDERDPSSLSPSLIALTLTHQGGDQTRPVGLGFAALALLLDVDDFDFHGAP